MSEETSTPQENNETKSVTTQSAKRPPKPPGPLRRWFVRLVIFAVMGTLGIAAGVGCALFILKKGGEFEDLEKLASYKPAQFTRVYARNGDLIDIISSQQRIMLEYRDIPPNFVHALVAVEDEYYFNHIGVSPLGILAALKDYVRTGRLRGASTLTQQLVKNITNDRRYSGGRKLKEQFLAVQLELRYTKEEIFAMYANEVPLGNQQFGIEAAARYYFGKSVGAMTLEECATLAGLPQAPSRFNPYRNPDLCLRRRNIVLYRMWDEGYITREAYDRAKKSPIELVDRKRAKNKPVAAHFVDKVRKYLFDKYGEEVVRTSRWDVHTTLDMTYQVIAEDAVRDGLKQVDKSMGYRPHDCPSVFTKEDPNNMALVTEYYDPSWHQVLQPGISIRGVVQEVGDDYLTVRIDEDRFRVDLEGLKWTKAKKGKLDKMFQLGDVPLFMVLEGEAEVGDLIRDARDENEDEALEDEEESAEDLLADRDEETADPERMVLRTDLKLVIDQEPQIEASFMAVDPHTGDLLAEVGGYDYDRSKFNRAEQAKRQVGSAFKPFVFGAALEKGYSLADLLFDEPTQFIDPTKFYFDDQGVLQVRASRRNQRRMKLGLIPTPKPYQPHNYYNRYQGQVTLRSAMAQSLNIVSVKLLNSVGYDHVLEYAERLEIDEGNDLQPYPSLALGAMEMTLADLVQAYGIYAVNGVRHEPRFIHHIMDAKGRAIEENPIRGKQVISPQNAFLVTQTLRAVVRDKKGTARRAQRLGLEVAGKTGTTDDYTDAWFIGYSPQIAAGAWVGRDLKETIARNRTGGNTALPIWLRFFEGIKAELDEDAQFIMPEGLRLMPIDQQTGKKMTRDCDCPEDDMIAEVFIPGSEPTEICSSAEKKRLALPWYLQKRLYEFDKLTGRIEPEQIMIDYASQQRALRNREKSAEEGL
ncbi:penicillin-binding protein 1A [Acanthopleuribacter pedis]